MNGYFLRGVDDEHLLVFRSDDPEEIFRVIRRLCECRDKDTRALAETLEKEWYEQYTRHNGQVKPDHKKSTNNSTRKRSRKTTDT